MKDIFLEKMRDISTACELQFSLSCEECGHTWRSAPAPLPACAPGDGPGEVARGVRSREKAAALRIAREGAQQGFNLCPVCGRVVCDACFRICRHTDMCRACAERLNEPGEAPVAWQDENGGDKTDE